jgi:hypothetical protein
VETGWFGLAPDAGPDGLLRQENHAGIHQSGIHPAQMDQAGMYQHGVLSKHNTGEPGQSLSDSDLGLLGFSAFRDSEFQKIPQNIQQKIPQDSAHQPLLNNAQWGLTSLNTVSGQDAFSRKSTGCIYARWEKDRQRLLAHAEYIDVQPGAGIDDIRAVRQKLSHTRHSQGWRVVLIPEAHMLSISCSNALLKWIESPPPKTLFLLTASGDLPKTLASRCMAYTMPPLSVEHFSVVHSVRNQGPSQGQTLGEALTPDVVGTLSEIEQQWLFTLSQGCLGLEAFWRAHRAWAQQGWELLYRSCMGEWSFADDWMKETLIFAPYFWEMLYVWASNMYHWSYEHAFLWHWDSFWQVTWSLIQEHGVYNTDVTTLVHTVLARIHGFFAHYKVPPMPLYWHPKEALKTFETLV